MVGRQSWKEMGDREKKRVNQRQRGEEIKQRGTRRDLPWDTLKQSCGEEKGRGKNVIEERMKERRKE